MRLSIKLAALVFLATIFFSLRMPIDRGSYHLLVMVLIGLPCAAIYIYGARLADLEHRRQPEKYKPFTGLTNIPIYGALWRAAMAGDYVAKWAFAGVIVLPPVGMALIFLGPRIMEALGWLPPTAR